MVTPKSLVFSLHKYWDIIEALAHASRDLTAFEESHVLAVIRKYQPQTQADEAGGILRALCNADLLQWLSRSSSLQLNPLVLDFVRGLTREHELGLSSVLKARVEAIKEATAQLREGLERADHDVLRRGAARLSELFRRISQQLDQDRHAILELAENAKSSDAAMPAAKRYQAVLEAYDQYVEPMNEMMDSGSSGTFYPYLETAEHTLDAASEMLSVQGALYTHRVQLRQVAYQAKELRRLGRVVAQQCADTLLPLREEARQHNELSAAISYLLGRVRKQGLRHGLKARDVASMLPLWRQERGRRIGVGYEVRALMAEAQAFTPRIQAFPDELTEKPEAPADWVDETALKARLQAALPVENLLLWLQQQYGYLSDRVLLRLYHDLVREPGWNCTLQSNFISSDLNTLRVHYYPHQLHAK
ncbi:MAG: hypothetical protein R3F53_19410 [Gammaproteobacteria bacterium]